MIEARAAADLRSLEGIYRLSGQTSQIKALRLGFDAGAAPALGPATANIHSVGSLLKVRSAPLLGSQLSEVRSPSTKEINQIRLNTQASVIT